MASTLTDRLSSVHPKMLRARGESDRKNLADAKREVGQDIERALEASHISKQAAAFQMGYEDQGTVSRWCSGLERPQFDKLNALPGFEAAYLIERAKRHPEMVVETTVKIRKRAGA